jgi:uncharacterized delta-60 repeat protein
MVRKSLLELLARRKESHMRTLFLSATACLLAAFLTPTFTAQAIVTQQWDYRFAGPYHGLYSSCGLGVDSAGNSYICGFIWRPGAWGTEIYAKKFSPAGDSLWTSHYGGPTQGENPNDMVVDATGNLYIAGTKFPAGGYYHFITLKYNTSGQVLWEASYEGPYGDDRSTALVVDSSGNVFVTGISADSNFNYDYVTLKYNPSGQLLWMKRYSSTSISDDQATDVAVDAGGNVYVTGRSSPRGWPNLNYNIITLKYNSMGQQQWVVSYDGPAHDYDTPATLRLDAQANVYITGSTTISTNNADYITLKYSSAGVQQWAVPFGYQHDPEESGTDLAVDTDGSVIVTGQSACTGNTVIKYNARGIQQWQRLSGTNDSWGTEKTILALDADHNIYAAGMEGTNWNLECATCKYDARGNLRWMAKYNPDDCCEEGYGVALDAHGDVYVIGKYWWPEYGDVHPLLVKYNQIPGDVYAAMVPTVSPVVIPVGGGTFSYNLQTFNTVHNNLPTEFWWKLIYPPPSQITQLLPPVLMMLPQDSATFLRSQRIPGNLPFGIYHYVIYAGDYPDIFWATDTISVIISNTGEEPVGEDRGQGIGNREQAQDCRVSLGPNPFNPTTALSYELRVASYVSLIIFDTSGRTVATLADGWQEIGTHEVTFDGSKLASGVYLYQLEVSGFGATPTKMSGKMVLLK